MDPKKTFPLNRLFKDAVKRGLTAAVPYYIVLWAPRGEGKTFTAAQVVSHLTANDKYVSPGVEPIKGFNTFILAPTEEQGMSNITDQGYLDELQKHGEDGSLKGVVGGTGFHYIPTNSRIMFGGWATKKSKENLRGKHPNLVFQDEAQSINDPGKWMTIVGEMGKSKNCVYLLTGTGSIYPKNLMKYVAGLIRKKEVAGEIIHLTAYDMYRMNPCRQRRQEIKKVIRQNTLTQTVRRGGITSEVVVQVGQKSSKFITELMVRDCYQETDTEAQLAYPRFSEDNILPLYRPDPKDQIVLVADWGISDPVHIGFFAIQPTGRIIKFDELQDNRGLHPDQFAPVMLYRMEEHGLVKVKKHLVGRNEILQPSIIRPFTFYGDQHGNGSFWHNNYEKNYFAIYQVNTSYTGIDTVNTMLNTGQLVITEDCPRTISRLRIHKLEKIVRRGEENLLDLAHKNSHPLVTLNYIATCIDVPSLWLRKPVDMSVVPEPVKPAGPPTPNIPIPLNDYIAKQNTKSGRSLQTSGYY